MTPKELHDAYNRLRDMETKDLFLDKLPKLTLASTIWQESGETNPEQAIETFGPTAGWLRYQPEIRQFDGGEWQPSRPNAGRLLCGEMVNCQGASLSVRPDGAGSYRLTVAKREEETTHLIEVVTYLAEANRPGLRYQVAFTVDGEVTVAGSRFVGFTQTGR